ncbi:MAG: hypothetical protein GDA51_10395 [Ekhidna sp.]|nr:hypothetical protein [Ekhidna sp.]
MKIQITLTCLQCKRTNIVKNRKSHQSLGMSLLLHQLWAYLIYHTFYNTSD